MKERVRSNALPITDQPPRFLCVRVYFPLYLTEHCGKRGLASDGIGALTVTSVKANTFHSEPFQCNAAPHAHALKHQEMHKPGLFF